MTAAIMVGVIPGLGIVALLLFVLAVLGKLPDAAQSVASLIPSRRRVREALRAASVAKGLDPDWLDAIGWVESQWRLDAVNLSGPDGARGGAWGPTQITATTARAYGYTGPMEDLTRDPDLAAKWSAIILAAGNVETIEDAGAWWNAGKRTLDKAPTVTREEYVPRLLAALSRVQSSPPEETA